MVSVVEMPRPRSPEKKSLVAFRIEDNLLEELRGTRAAIEYKLNDTQLFIRAIKLLIEHDKAAASKAKGRVKR